MKILKQYGSITLSIFIMAIGVYFFKFPNHFCFGGVTGAAAVVARITSVSAGTFTMFTNLALLIIGCFAVDRIFALRTAYASTLLSLLLILFERIYPLDAPLSGEPILELIFAITLPAISTALLFYVGASSGGTDILAIILKKHTHLRDSGIALFLCDLAMIIAACFVFDIETALYSFVGLTVKSLVIDKIIQNMTLCKSITIICADAEPICQFIMEQLHKGATIIEGKGAYTHSRKYVVITTLTRHQADQLRGFIHNQQLEAFVSVASTNEVFGKGFEEV